MIYVHEMIWLSIFLQQMYTVGEDEKLNTLETWLRFTRYIIILKYIYISKTKHICVTTLIGLFINYYI